MLQTIVYYISCRLQISRVLQIKNQTISLLVESLTSGMKPFYGINYPCLKLKNGTFFICFRLDPYPQPPKMFIKYSV